MARKRERGNGDVWPRKNKQEFLGHANISITLDTYRHVIPGMGNQTVTAMEVIFA